MQQLFMLFFLLPVLASASYEGPMRFSTFWPCDGNGSFCATRILAEGIIQPNSAVVFQEFLAAPRALENSLPPVPTVVFDSPGGSLFGGMALGRMIRAKKFDTEIASNYDRVNRKLKDGYETFIPGAKCASACVLAFAGGVHRGIDEGSKMGVHQFSGGGRDIGEAAAQVTLVQIAAYLSDMGVKRELLDIASLVPASSIYWLSPKQMHLTRLNNAITLVSPWGIRAFPNGQPIVEVRVEVLSGKTVALHLLRNSDRIAVVVDAEFETNLYSPNRVNLFPTGEVGRMSFMVGSYAIKIAPTDVWKKSTSPGRILFRTYGSISLEEARLLARAKDLKLDDDFAHALQDVSIQVTLGTENLSSGIATLLRN